MSHIERDMTVALTESKAKRKPFVVRRLVPSETAPVRAGGGLAQPSPVSGGAQGAGGVASAPAPAPPRQTIGDRLNALDAALMTAVSADQAAAIYESMNVQKLREYLAGEPALATLNAIMDESARRVRDHMASEPDPEFRSDGRDPMLDEALGTTPDFPGDRP